LREFATTDQQTRAFMPSIFDLPPLQLGQSLFSALGGVAAARSAQIAVRGRNSGPRRVETNVNQARLERQARESERILKGYAKLTIKQKRAVKTLDKVNDRLDQMKAIMLEARELIVCAQAPGATPENQRDLANRFDQLLGKYNLKAKGAGFFGVNLIGGSIRDIFDAGSLDVPSKPGSLVDTVYAGNFLGSDYVITDNDGNKFLPSLFHASVIQFPNADAADSGVLLKNDDTIVYDRTTGAISITRSGESTPILEGTLETKGVGVLGSYFYGNFQDPDKLDDALEDITAALSSLRFNVATFGVQQKRAEVVLKFSEDKISESKTVVARLAADTFATERLFALEEQKRQLIFESSLNAALSYNSQGLPSLLQSALFGFNI
jgi:hypothetical protein